MREEPAPYGAQFDEETKEIAKKVETVVARHTGVVDWQSNDEVQRLMRRDIKRVLRPTGDYTEERLDELGEPDRRIGAPEDRAVTERDSIRFGDTTIEYDLRRSARRRKTVQISVDGGGVQVAAPMTTPAE